METLSPVPDRKAAESSLSLDVHLGYWLRLVSNQVSGAFARALQRRHLSAAEWVALNLIARSPKLASAALADAMGMTRGGISKVLDKMTDKEWISRTTSTVDNRVQMLSLTRTGSRLLPALWKAANDNDAQFFGVLDTDEQATLRRILRKVADAHGFKSSPVD